MDFGYLYSIAQSAVVKEVSLFEYQLWSITDPLITPGPLYDYQAKAGQANLLELNDIL